MAVWELPGKKWELWKEINKAEAVCSLCDSYETDWGVEFQNMWPGIFSSTCQIFNGTLQSRETACSGTLGRMDGMMELNRKMSLLKYDSDKLGGCICRILLKILHRNCTCSRLQCTMVGPCSKLRKTRSFLCLNPRFLHLYMDHEEIRQRLGTFKYESHPDVTCT